MDWAELAGDPSQARHPFEYCSADRDRRNNRKNGCLGIKVNQTFPPVPAVAGEFGQPCSALWGSTGASWVSLQNGLKALWTFRNSALLSLDLEFINQLTFGLFFRKVMVGD